MSAAGAGVSVQLSSSSSQITAPATVTVAQGSNTAKFNVTSAVIDHDESANIVATLKKASVQTPLALVGLKPIALACSPKSVASGSPVICQITLNSASTTGAISLALSSNNSHAKPPASLVTTPGQSSVTFEAPTTLVMKNQGVTMSTAFHAVTLHDAVTLTPAPPVLKVPGTQSARPGKTTSFTVSATDPAGLAVVISASGLPANASFDASRGLFNWAPNSSQLGPHTVHFTAIDLTLASSTRGVVIDVGSDTPVITELANVASYVAQDCSPGAVATLFGAGFVNTAAKSVQTGPIPTQLNGLRVKANGHYAPVLYAAEFQVNFQCPQLPAGEALELIIESPTGTSSPFSSKVQYATPGIFSLDGSGKGQGVILITNSKSMAMPYQDANAGQPAMPGQSVSIFASGLGPVNVTLPSGQPAPSHPLAKIKAPVDVLIGGVKGSVQFAGLAPGSVGLYQVDVKVPAGIAAGDAIPVKIIIHLPDGTLASSNVVTMAVAAAQ